MPDLSTQQLRTQNQPATAWPQHFTHTTCRQVEPRFVSAPTARRAQFGA